MFRRRRVRLRGPIQALGEILMNCGGFRFRGFVYFCPQNKTSVPLLGAHVELRRVVLLSTSKFFRVSQAFCLEQYALKNVSAT